MDRDQVHNALMEMFNGVDSVPKKLRAMWALYVTGGLNQELLVKLLEHQDEHIHTVMVHSVSFGRKQRECFSAKLWYR